MRLNNVIISLKKLKNITDANVVSVRIGMVVIKVILIEPLTDVNYVNMKLRLSPHNISKQIIKVNEIYIFFTYNY